MFFLILYLPLTITPDACRLDIIQLYIEFPYLQESLPIYTYFLQCYTSVLKSIVREEDAAGTQFGPPVSVALRSVPLQNLKIFSTFAPLLQDQKDSRDSALSFLDNITWPEVVRAYLDSTREHDHVLEIVTSPKFPRVGAEEKILVSRSGNDQEQNIS